MIEIKVPYKTDDPTLVDIPAVPTPLLRACIDMRDRYPGRKSRSQTNGTHGENEDRFQEEYRCRLVYNNFNGIHSFIWDNDADYTAFLLRWS